jgi:hypothetical protein
MRTTNFEPKEGSSEEDYKINFFEEKMKGNDYIFVL